MDAETTPPGISDWHGNEEQASPPQPGPPDSPPSTASGASTASSPSAASTPRNASASNAGNTPNPTGSPGICQPTERIPGGVPARFVAAQDEIRAVRYEVRPATSGYAHREVHPDGSVSGGHLSGDPQQPMVSIEHGSVSQACIRAVWAAAMRLRSTTDESQPPPNGAGFASISLDRVDGRTVVLSWPHRQEPSDPRLRELQRLLGEMEIGYW